MDSGKGLQKEFIYIAVAVVAGVFGIYQVNNYVQGQLEEAQNKLGNTVALLKVKKDLGVGSEIMKQDIEEVAVPKAFKIDTRAVKSSDVGRVIGKRLASPVSKDELLLWYQLDMAASSTISEKIPQGKKAITIMVNNVTGVDGLLRPKMVIDIYGTYNLKRRNDAEDILNSVKVLENVTIIAAGDLTAGDSNMEQRAGHDGYQTVTVLVDKNDVERMILAQELAQSKGGRLYCILRSEMDAGEKPTQTAALSATEFLQNTFGGTGGQSK